MAELKIHLLGQFMVTLHDTPVTNFSSDKVRALLAHLVAEAQYPHRREILANFLWSDQPDESCRANLRRALSNMRKCIEDHEATPPFFTITRQDIQFNLESSVWVDIAVVDQLYQQDVISESNHSQFRQILDLYQGEFLSGMNLADGLNFNEWAVAMRERQHRKAIAILKRVANYHEIRQDFNAGLPYIWRLVELEPWQENARRQLMRLLAITGKRYEALNQYKSLKKLLNEELDIEPEIETSALFEIIKAGKRPDVWDLESRESPLIKKNTIDLKSHPHEVFVDREKEIAELNQALDNAIIGRGNIIFIAGEAGSGKSMLATEFIRQAQCLHSLLVATIGFCNPFSGPHDPFLPFRETLLQLCGSMEHPWISETTNQSYLPRLRNVKPDAIESITHFGDNLVDTLISSQALIQLAGSLKETHPSIHSGLINLIDIKNNQFGSVPPQPKILSQFAAVLRTIARKHPLILLLDDLQWADAGTIDLLFHLGKQLTGSKILLLGAYRTEEVAIRHDGIPHPLLKVISEFKRNYGQITINLDQYEDSTFVDELLASEPNDLDKNFHDALQQYTNGHPLFTVELLRTLQEDGTLVRNNQGRWIINRSFQIQKLPPKVEGIIGERINRLPNDLQQALAVASIEGEVFTAEVIASVQGFPLEKVIHLLGQQLDKQHQLIKAQRMVVDQGKTITTYKFRHILFQKYIYDHLDTVEKVDYHARVGAALETLIGDNYASYAGQLARHFHNAKQFDKAIQYYQLAGVTAGNMSGYTEAITLFEKALELVNSLPASSERDKLELGLQLQTGLAYQAIQGYASKNVGKAFQRAWELSQNVDDPKLAKQSYQLLFSYYANTAQFDIAQEINDLDNENLDRSTPFGNLEFYWGDGYLDLCLGRLGSAYRNFENMLKYYDPKTSKSYVKSVGMEAGVMGNGWASVLAAWVGYLDQSREHIKSSLNIAAQCDSGVVKTDALFYSAWAYQELGDDIKASELLNEAMDLAQKYNIFWITSFLKLLVGKNLARNGEYKTALSEIHEALEIFSLVGFVTMKPVFFQGLAEVYCLMGKVEEGMRSIREAEHLAEQTGEHRYSSQIQRTKGDLLFDSDQHEAEEAYRQAIFIAQQQEAKTLELQAVLGLCRLWQKQGKQKQAYKLLQPIFNWFTEGLDTPWLVEARQMLTELFS